jgi:hypothetical protein
MSLYSRLDWSYCSGLQYNRRSDLLLVSGVLRTNIARTRRGEILIISLGEDLGTTRSRISVR